MIIRRPLAVLMLLGTAANAASLPLKPGIYVLAATTCQDPPFAAMLTYDGGQFSYPHARDCRSAILAHHGRTYRVEETCAALGDGAPSAPAKSTSTYTIESATRFGIVRTKGQATLRYRWCAAQ